MWLVLATVWFIIDTVYQNIRAHFLSGTFFSAACESIAVAISFLIPFDYILFITGGVLISLR